MGFWDWLKKNKKIDETAEYSDVEESNVEETNLEGTNLEETNLEETNLEETNLVETSEDNNSDEVNSDEKAVNEIVLEESVTETSLAEETEIAKSEDNEAGESASVSTEESTSSGGWDDDDWDTTYDDDWGNDWGIDPEDMTEKNIFERLKDGLSKTRDNIVSGMDALFNSDEKIDDDFYDELEETLILGDLGVHTTENILDKLKESVKSEHIKKRSDCKEFLVNTLKEIMNQGETAYEFENVPSVVFIIGVNGVGKTTSIGKLAAHLKAMNKRVMMAACDTFRAAAGSQLEEWSHRAGVELIGGVEGQDPSSVLYDAVNAAVARNVDVLLVDTAGRLHNKKNLMDELKKMNKIIDKVCGDNLHRENLIVLDASTGQNALNQAKEFGEVADLTGIILTKMDGTAKGGIAIAIESELGIPVKYIGVGEKIVDLQKFDSDSFIDALFDRDYSEIENNDSISQDTDSDDDN